MMRSFSFKTKLFGLVLCLVFLSLGIGATSFYSSGKIIKESDHIATVNLTSIWNLAYMRNETHNVIRNVIKLSVPGNSESEINHINESLKKAIVAFKKYDDDYAKSPKGSEEEKAHQTLLNTWNSFLGVVERESSALNSSDPTLHSKGLELIHTGFDKEYHAVFDALANVVAGQFKEAQYHIDRTNEIKRASTVFTSLFTAFGSLCGLLAGFFLSRSMTRALNGISKELAGQAMGVASASEQISESSTELSTSALKQAGAIQQTAASIEEVNAMVTKNAANAQKSETCSHESKKAAEKGQQAVDQMIHAIQDISQSNEEMRQAIDTTNQELSSIVSLIGEIANKTRVINDIVFQTKLLSFNASVEAARAGENGKGFSVVAEEIGSLAQLSGSAAHEISSMLSSSTQKVETIAQATKSRIETLITTGSHKIKTGVRTAHECQEALKEISGSVEMVTSMIQEISTASSEQARGVHEITKAISQLEQTTQQNSAVSRQSATASEELAGQSAVVHDLVKKLVQLVEGDNEARAA